jgi:hypothetical protein
MGTRLLILGIAFVLLTVIPAQADLPVSDEADQLQLQIEMQQQHQTAIRAVSGLIIYASTIPSTAQDPTSAARRPLSQTW